MARPRKIVLNEETENGFASNVEMEDVQIPEPIVKVEQPMISNDSDTSPPICELQGLSEEEMKLVISSRIKTIIGKTQIPFIPAFITYKDSDSTSAPPLNAIVDNVDHVYLMEAWEFYKVNASKPNAVEFLELVRMSTRNPERVFSRVAPISLM